ncbi:MAG: HypC/HybG/HupF family hydrogenase formation chaperone [Epsilonproteobacteria bacterium]|nr:HypC/HybG/HupF family hydrogenase formation chaperone [Campylobacterota bacterium]
MCLSIPSEVIEIDENNVATVDTMGIKRKVSLDLIAETVNIGDYILIHVGFAMSKIDKENALESLKIYRKMIKIMETEENNYVNKAL